MPITIEQGLDENVRDDAEEVRSIIQKNNEDHLDAVINGGGNNLILQPNGGRLSGRVIQKLENEGRSCEIIFEVSTKLLISTKLN